MFDVGGTSASVAMNRHAEKAAHLVLNCLAVRPMCSSTPMRCSVLNSVIARRVLNYSTPGGADLVSADRHTYYRELARAQWKRDGQIGRAHV